MNGLSILKIRDAQRTCDWRHNECKLKFALVKRLRQLKLSGDG